MKRAILVFLLLISTLISLVGCTKYKPVKSTEEEAETVITIKYDNKEYEVPYELYRTFFLNYKERVDGGDSSVWQGDDKAKYIEEIDKLILDSICELYAVFHLCLVEGIDPFSKKVNESIEDYVTASVDGGYVDSMFFAGYDGDYDAYLNKLKENNMNYSVQEILFRCAVCSELLDAHYEKKTDGSGNAIFTKEDVKEFYDADSSVRVIQQYFPLMTDIDKEINNEERINSIRHEMLLRATDEYELGTYLISNSTAGEDLRNGLIISEYSLNQTYYKELTDTALSLSFHEVSEVIKVVNGSSDGYYILYKIEKTDDHFDKRYDEIEAVYVANLIGERLHEAKLGLIEGATKSDVLVSIDYSSISM